MATRVFGPTGSKRRKRFLLAPVLLVALAALYVIVGAQATPPEQNPPGYFELDKNIQNNQAAVLLGAMGGNTNASQTSFTVCQALAANPTPPITIQVDAEQMTVGAIANASGGGCSGSFKRTYSSVTRGANSTVAASHGGSGVQANVTQLVNGTNATMPGDDWNQVFDAVQANGAATNPCSGPSWTGGSNIKACDFIHDPPDTSIFTGGGSKDDLDINVGTPPNVTNNWLWTNGSVPDADDISDGFAAKYEGPNPCPVGQTVGCDHQFLYFGADRSAVNGAKDMGFWFFRSPVSLNPNGTFSGTHTVGDLLILGTFTNGGAATTIRIFKWVGPNNGADTNGVLLTGGNAGDCVPGGGSDLCNTVNNTTITSPWAYQSKISGTPANTIYAGGLMEGGADLTSLNLQGCFATFLAETRSSPSVGAQLKDFLIGKFESCSSGLTTTPQDAVGSNDGSHDLTDHSTPPNGVPDVSIGTGSVSVTDKAVLSVSGAGSGFTGTLSFALCGPIASGTCDKSDAAHTGTTIAAAAGTNPVTANGTYHSVAAAITKVGRYCWRGEFTSGTQGVPNASDSSASECFEVLPVTPNLSTSASGPVEVGSNITDTATLTGTANQPGTPNVINPTTPGGPAGGSILFSLYGPSDPTCQGTAIFTATRAVTGDGTYPKTGPPQNQAAVSYPTTATGTYHWVASYTPDTSGNTLGASGSCGDNNETSVAMDAKVSIAPDDVNEINQPHTFTATFQVNRGDGNGFLAESGASCTITLTNSNGAVANPAGPFTGTTDANGQFSATFTSASAGVVTGHATCSKTVSGVLLSRQTNGLAGNSGDATKRFVDAYITINPPEATNKVFETHTLTVFVAQDDGLPAGAPGDAVTGFGKAPAGTPVTVTLTPDATATVIPGTDNCATLGLDGNGMCTVTFTSSTPGTVTAHAAVTFLVGGVSLHRETDGNAPNSGDAIKHFQSFPTTTTTRQFVFPQDKAKVTVGGGGDLSGNLSLRLFDTSAHCLSDDGTSSAVGLLYSEGATGDSIQHPISGPSPQFGTTNNTSFRITSDRTVYWNVRYTSNKAAQPGSSSTCEENTAVAYVGNDGTIAIP